MTLAPRDPPAGFEQLLDYRRHLLERLERQPGEFAARVAAIPAEAWATRRDAQGRSVLWLAAHVRDVEVLAYLPRLRHMLAEVASPHGPEVDHDDAVSGDDPAEPMTGILESWSRARAELVNRLRPLGPAGWSRAGFYAPAGSRTVQWWAERMYAHAREHLRTI